MSLDHTPEVAAEMMIARLELTEGGGLVLESTDGDDVPRYDVHTFTDSDDWDAVNIDNLHLAKDFTRVRILDFTGCRELVYKAETVRLEGYRWKVDRVDPPFGQTRIWTIRLNRIERLP